MATNRRFTHIDLLPEESRFVKVRHYKGVPYMVQKAQRGQTSAYSATLLLRGGCHVQIRESEAYRVIDAMTVMGPISQEYRDDIMDMIHRRCEVLNLELQEDDGRRKWVGVDNTPPPADNVPRKPTPHDYAIAKQIAKKMRGRLSKEVIYKGMYGGFADPDGSATRQFKPTKKELGDLVAKKMRQIQRTQQLQDAICNLNLDLGAPSNR